MPYTAPAIPAETATPSLTEEALLRGRAREPDRAAES